MTLHEYQREGDPQVTAHPHRTTHTIASCIPTPLITQVTKIKEDFDRKLRAKEEEMEKIMAMMQEMKLREQDFKDQVCTHRGMHTSHACS